MALVTAFSYERHTGLVPFLSTVSEEAEHILVRSCYDAHSAPHHLKSPIDVQAVLPCIHLDHPNVAEFKEALPDCKAWLFVGKGGAMVRIRRLKTNPLHMYVSRWCFCA